MLISSPRWGPPAASIESCLPPVLRRFSRGAVLCWLAGDRSGDAPERFFSARHAAGHIVDPRLRGCLSDPGERWRAPAACRHSGGWGSRRTCWLALAPSGTHTGAPGPLPPFL